MSDLKVFKELVDDIWGIVFGTERRPRVKDKVDVATTDYPYNTELASSPSSSWTKHKLKEFMKIHNVIYNSGDTKADLIQKIKLGTKE